MADRFVARPSGTPLLEIKNLNVFYGRSHALQGVDLTLRQGALSVVGRNGMGKTTLCNAIMGLVRASSGSIRFAGEELVGRAPADIARLGIGYVPQGRRLWRSLTVDEHLRIVAGERRGAWTIERIYDTFPRLAERKANAGSQLSGGEQQMVAISRALLLNPRLLVMDEPTEGLAPVIVAQVDDILLRLAEDGEIAVLLIEQKIAVATEVTEAVAIMVNGRINRVIDSRELAADRELQERLLGVGRHGHAEVADDGRAAGVLVAGAQTNATPTGPVRIYMSNPKPPTRWSQPVPAAQIEAQARTASAAARRSAELPPRSTGLPSTAGSDPFVVVAGTLDTKGDELRLLRDILKEAGLRTRLVDLSTSGKPSGADVPPFEVALNHPRGAVGLFSGDRGTSVAAMAQAFEAWIKRQADVAGIISAGGSGGTAMAAPAMRALPIGVPKVLISTVASGNVAAYVGPSDIMMMYSVTDVQGLNSISRQVLANGAQAMAGMVKQRLAERAAGQRRAQEALPAVGLTMFGVTTTCVRQVTAQLKDEYDCLVFHATGIGGQSMEKLVDSQLLSGVIDVTTTEICDMMMGGVFPASEDRFGAIIRARLAYVGSVGALDMVNFGAPETVPERYKGRSFYPHNPQVTLMRTTAEENERLGRWIGERLNRMEAPVRFLLPEGGVSALDAPGQPFHDPAADAALFKALEQTVRRTSNRQLVRLPYHINDAAFAAALVDAFRALHGNGRLQRRRAGGR